MPVIKSHYDKEIILRWNGNEYVIPAQGKAFVPTELVRAFFPKRLTDYFPEGITLTEKDIENFLMIFRDRWATCGINIDLEDFLLFLEKFEILDEDRSVTEGIDYEANISSLTDAQLVELNKVVRKRRK